MNCNNKKIGYGDRIFARLSQGGRIIVEFMVDQVNDMKEVMKELRRLTAGCRGMSRLYVRNMSQGWSHEQSLMLYPSAVSTASVSRDTAERVAEPFRRNIFNWNL